MITAAAAERGFTIHAEAVDSLVSARTAHTQGGVNPSLLMYGLRELLAAATEKKWTVIEAATVAAYGGPDPLILQSLDSKIAALNATHRELFFRWGNILISSGGRRATLSERALVEYAGNLNRFALSLLPLLVEIGILRILEFPDGPRYEIAREPLVPVIRNWWTRRETELIARGKASFRVRSISVAVGSIVALYVVWLLMEFRK
jgi:hypothetical protein